MLAAQPLRDAHDAAHAADAGYGERIQSQVDRAMGAFDAARARALAARDLKRMEQHMVAEAKARAWRRSFER